MIVYFLSYPFAVKFLGVSYVWVLGAVFPPVAPFPSYVIVYVFALKFATYSKLPVVPFSTSTFVCGVVPFEPVHPTNV